MGAAAASARLGDGDDCGGERARDGDDEGRACNDGGERARDGDDERTTGNGGGKRVPGRRQRLRRRRRARAWVMRQRRQRRSRPPTAGGDDADAGAHGELKLCRRPQDLVANTSPTTTGSMSSSSAHGRSTGWGGHLLFSLVSPFWTARGEHVGGLRKWRRAGGSSRVLVSSSNSCLACYGRRRRSCTYVFTVLKLSLCDMPFVLLILS
ncbi:uncharacterized protein [Lolium perenne]|uniref:uncharacterized protein n=1 Tax=Lolium perenne TaxID=4522 RepID=UPI003A99053D